MERQCEECVIGKYEVVCCLVVRSSAVGQSEVVCGGAVRRVSELL